LTNHAAIPDPDVPDFSSRRVFSSIKLSVENEPGTHSSPEFDE
jgi:hypothetical protein